MEIIFSFQERDDFIGENGVKKKYESCHRYPMHQWRLALQTSRLLRALGVPGSGIALGAALGVTPGLAPASLRPRAT